MIKGIPLQADMLVFDTPRDKIDVKFTFLTIDKEENNNAFQKVICILGRRT